MAELREPIYLEEKLKEIQGTGRLSYRSKALPTWCPGCGYFSMTEGVASALNQLGLAHKDVVIVSGIGCASRFPFFMDTYGFHTLHGRTLPVATGIKLANDQLTVIVVGGDGDGFAIGGGHIPHAARRNVDITYLLFDNGVYGLTKGQVSPTSVMGFKTKTSPYENRDAPLKPLMMLLSYRRQLGRPGLRRPAASPDRHDRAGDRAPRLLVSAHPVAVRDLRQDQHDLPEPERGGARPAGEPRPERHDRRDDPGDGRDHPGARRALSRSSGRPSTTPWTRSSAPPAASRGGAGGGRLKSSRQSPAGVLAASIVGRLPQGSRRSGLGPLLARWRTARWPRRGSNIPSLAC